MGLEIVKTCIRCGEEKDIDEFHRRSSTSETRRGICAECVAEEHAVRYSSNRDKYATKQRARIRALNRLRLAHIGEFNSLMDEEMKAEEVS